MDCKQLYNSKKLKNVHFTNFINSKGELKDMLTFLSESTKDFEATETVGGFNYGREMNSFDDIYKEAYNELLGESVDLFTDISQMIKKTAVMEALKDKLLGELVSECTMMREAEAAGEGSYGTHSSLDKQLSTMFDNCVDDLVKESTRVGSLLPIKAIDFPILIKQQLKLASKDIIQTEVTKSPLVKKHIEQTYIIDPKDQTKRWKYPQAFFTDEFKEIYLAGKGLPIKDTVVKLPAYKFDVAKELTDAVDPDKEEFTFDLQIPYIYTGDTQEHKIKLDRPMRISLQDNVWLGGVVQKKCVDQNGVEVDVDDVVSGTVDFVKHTVSLNSLNGQITGISFSGFLSNEKNTRDVSFDYAREEIEWKIEDGMRASVAYSLEQLEDTKALMDIDLYQKTYNNLSEFMTQMEDSKVLQWLDEKFEEYKGIEISVDEVLSWGSFITEGQFDCDSTALTTALPSEFIEKMLKFYIDGLIVDICDRAKLEDMTFVIYGNPRLIRLLNPVVNWVTRPGSTSNGVKLDYGYGIMTSGDVKVQVVSTKKVNVKYDEDEMLFKGLRLIPYPLSDEQFTFCHFKYTSHILTAQNSAYRPSTEDYPGGSQTYLMGVSRYTNACVQGIQAEVSIANAEKYIRKI
jgi:hypothetical protein